MARCEICTKGTTTGRKLSINRSQVSKRAKRKVRANIQSKRILLDDGSYSKVKVCTTCLRTMKAMN
ncbi:MAG: 50S ribosomal protein L28 [Clostridiales bacterium]|nr:50S ribosomal protein L28 [Clostridiales bacterium]